jgi:hypothetical protein
VPNGGVFVATGCVSNDGRFFIFGGLNMNSSMSNHIQIYNATNNSWNTISPNMTSGTSIADVWMSCALDSSSGLMYITGGQKNGTRFYSYNVSSNTITNLSTSSSPSPFNKWGQGSFVNNGKLYVFGGQDDSTSVFSSSTYIYDIADSSWSTGGNMTQAADSFGYATDGSRFYVIGGLGNEGYLEYTQVYDISSGVWSINYGIVYSGGMYGSAAVFLDGTLHSIGGWDDIYLSVHRIASLCGVYTYCVPNQCQNATCNPTTGNCVYTNVSGRSCNSNNQCLLNTTCSNGECTGQSKNCFGSTCDPSTGECIKSSSSSSGSALVLKVATSTTTAAIVFVGIGILILLLLLRRKKKNSITENYTKIDAIEVVIKIGGGNFGEVYYGKWNGTTEVALKQLKANEHFEEFVQEAAMLQSLNHPNIVRFFGIHTTPNREHFLVMEYMIKGSLDGVLRTEKEQIFLLDLLSM